ncbi:hypothetical protein [Acinetobacter sp. WCHAc010034]|uniref:hypothetical protein n=1 Tax=Acinetobacter sp. WCHAc010034 TaxID=1879049 RepID=UPI000AE369CA|nr:hypothetical protein [Acinetobacter sp. WCHAc010034]
MKQQLGVFTTNQINKSGFRILASALMNAEESHHFERLTTGLPAGLPAFIQHDMHRPVGWSQVLGLLIDSKMVRVVGVIKEAETEQEKIQLAQLASHFWESHHNKGSDTLKSDLLERANLSKLDEFDKFLKMEAYVLSRKNVASSLYPELFNISSNSVDKDGLTDYKTLCQSMKQIQPGVFLDKKHNLLIFAHRFFRRSLSHRNKFNEYFLSSFDKTVAESPHLTPRLRLDPDLIGHPDTVTNLLELEYWWGPHFNDDISSIPNGVTEHKASEKTRYFEGVDRTQIWWKSPETRLNSIIKDRYRSFEIEELIENSSGGLPDEQYGCRYAHAEYSIGTSAITHFDGAIRAYPQDEYLERIGLAIDQAGKHSDYTKLFRFDGSMTVDLWKKLLSDYFKGNPLIPEYLGVVQDDIKIQSKEATNEDVSTTDIEEPVVESELAVFISLTHGDSPHESYIEPSTIVLPDERRLRTIETGGGAIDEFIRSKFDMTNLTSIAIDDGILNLAKVTFGTTSNLPTEMQDFISGFSNSLLYDIEHNGLQRIAVPISWFHNKLLINMVIKGCTQQVYQLLVELLRIIDPLKPASEWIENLASAITTLAPISAADLDLNGVLQGHLSYKRTGSVKLRMKLPDSQIQGLLDEKPDWLR